MKVELNLTREQAADFIDWLANDKDGFGHTLTDFETRHKGKEPTDFIINGHSLSNYSNRMNHVIIDHCYASADNRGTVVYGGKEYKPLDYCLMRLGF